MPQKITLAEIEHKVEVLAARLHTPLRLTRWSPGDGWTRYRIETKKGHYFTYYNMTKQEIAQALSMAHATLDALERVGAIPRWTYPEDGDLTPPPVPASWRRRLP